MDTMDTMDTISNLAAAASKAIWGENKAGEEPVSGEMGNVAAGEPYDAGNIGGKPSRTSIDSEATKHINLTAYVQSNHCRLRNAKSVTKPTPLAQQNPTAPLSHRQSSKAARTQQLTPPASVSTSQQTDPPSRARPKLRQTNNRTRRQQAAANQRAQPRQPPRPPQCATTRPKPRTTPARLPLLRPPHHPPQEAEEEEVEPSQNGPPHPPPKPRRTTTLSRSRGPARGPSRRSPGSTAGTRARPSQSRWRVTGRRGRERTRALARRGETVPRASVRAARGSSACSRADSRPMAGTLTLRGPGRGRRPIVSIFLSTRRLHISCYLAICSSAAHHHLHQRGEHSMAEQQSANTRSQAFWSRRECTRATRATTSTDTREGPRRRWV